jgi:3-phosphoshikimate 1-carboxyvinyltransferase
MALYADGTTTLRNIASWRVKETDRIAAMACELRKLGAFVEEGSESTPLPLPPSSLLPRPDPCLPPPQHTAAAAALP